MCKCFVKNKISPLALTRFALSRETGRDSIVSKVQSLQISRAPAHKPLLVSINLVRSTNLVSGANMSHFLIGTIEINPHFQYNRYCKLSQTYV